MVLEVLSEVWVAEWLALPTSDLEVPRLNPAEDGILLMTALHCTEPFTITLLSPQSDFNNVKRAINTKIIMQCFKKGNFQYLVKECAQYCLTA